MALYDPPSSSELEPGADVDLAEAAERLGITPAQAGNLLTLARGLLRLPWDYRHFHMSFMFRNPWNMDDGWYRSPAESCVAPGECGAVACAVGHGPSLLGIPLGGDEYWSDYCRRVFGVDPSALTTATTYTSWVYLFDACWASLDNTPRGAALRILRYLRRGLPEKSYRPEWLIGDYREEPLTL